MVKKNEMPPEAVRALEEAEERRKLLKDRPNPKKRVRWKGWTGAGEVW
jgi:hypothetical protein